MTETPDKIIKNKTKPPEWLIESIAESSINSKKIYFLYLSIFLYFILTLISVSDRQMILDASVQLPIINLKVSYNGFFLFAPLIVIFFNLYLQIYVSRLLGLLLELRSKYSTLEKRRLYPWIITIAEDPEPGFAGTVQRMMVDIIFWWSLPIILMLFNFYYAKKHQLFFSVIMGFYILLGLGVTYYFWSFYDHVKQQSLVLKAYRHPSYMINTQRRVFCAVIGLFIVLFWVYITPSVSSGRFSDPITKLLRIDLSYQTFKPLNTEKRHHRLNLNGVQLQGANLTSALFKDVDIRRARLGGADLSQSFLEKTDFRYADLSRVNFKDATLNYSDLSHTNLENADFKAADFNGVILEGANLKGANLKDVKNLRVGQLLSVRSLYKATLSTELSEALRKKRAHLFYGQLRGADLRGLDLERAYLKECDLTDIQFQGTNLAHANFYAARLNGANFTEANLEHAAMSKTFLDHAILLRANLKGVDFSKASLSKANLSNCKLNGANFQNANLRSADLSSAKFINADLRNADFSKSNLKDADFSGANLEGANLLSAMNVTVSQLSKAKSLSGISLNSEIEEILKKKHPALILTSYEGVDLSNADLKGRSLKGKNFSRCNLTNANLTGADLSFANLSNAILNDAILNDALLDHTNFAGADLKKISMKGVMADSAIFKNCRIENGLFDRAILNKTDFDNAILTSAILTNTKIRYASFKRTLLLGADLSGAEIRASDFSHARLTRANISGMHMRGKAAEGNIFEHADFKNANLSGADFSRARLLGAKNLTVRQLKYTESLKESKLDGAIEKQILKSYPHLIRSISDIEVSQVP